MGFPKALTKKQRKELVDIAWGELERFIKEWQRAPFAWNKERDVQVELASRIKSAIEKRGKGSYKANYKCIRDKVKGFDDGQEFSRLCCEPLVYYEYEKDKRDICYPDIVICDAPENPASPGEPWRKKRNEPIIWVCEIKYQREWKKPYSPEEKDVRDLEKIKCLFKQKEDGTEYACWLNMSRTRASSGDGFPKLPKNRRLRIYNIKLPSIKSKGE
jgi:hypothetical protein